VEDPDIVLERDYLVGFLFVMMISPLSCVGGALGWYREDEAPTPSELTALPHLRIGSPRATLPLKFLDVLIFCTWPES
jgi:hypothetical protein